jgi:tRNA(Ile)-lysidine synthase
MQRPNRPAGLVSRTRAAFLRHGFSLDAPAVVGVSGGLDSMALLQVVWELGLPCTVGHVNYGLRGADSDADEALVREACDVFAMPLFVHRPEPPSSPPAEGVQAWARRIRYDFLLSLPSPPTPQPQPQPQPQSQPQPLLLTAHHADDQTETVLLHLLRSSDPLAAAGMEAISRKGRHFRPWLGEPREAIRAFAVERGVTWREDASNASGAYLRNRIRHELLPVLEALRPGAAEHLARWAERLRPLGEAARAEVNAAERRCVVWDAEGVCVVDLAKWCAEPLREEVLLQAVAAFGAEATVADAVNKLGGHGVESGKEVETAVLYARRIGPTLRIEPRRPHRP